MSFSTLVRRKAKASADADTSVRRPASATASAEFWRAFLGRVERAAPLTSPDAATTAARSFEDDAATERRKEPSQAAPSIEPAVIARELGLPRFASVRALQRLRRDFALKNHPDRVPSTLRERATKRMMIANAMIDSALQRFQFGARSQTRAHPFESGKRV